MADLDLNAAVQAAARAFHAAVIDGGHADPSAPATWDELDHQGRQVLLDTIGAAVRAAAPLIECALGEQLERRDFDGIINGWAFPAALQARERRVREQAAQQLLDWADTISDDHPQNRTLRRHIRMCAQRVAPEPTEVREVPAGMLGGLAGGGARPSGASS